MKASSQLSRQIAIFRHSEPLHSLIKRTEALSPRIQSKRSKKKLKRLNNIKKGSSFPCHFSKTLEKISFFSSRLLLYKGEIQGLKQKRPNSTSQLSSSPSSIIIEPIFATSSSPMIHKVNNLIKLVNQHVPSLINKKLYDKANQMLQLIAQEARSLSLEDSKDEELLVEFIHHCHFTASLLRDLSSSDSLSLEGFWKKYGYSTDLPDYEIVGKDEIPKIYYDLLWRHDLITPALEKFYEGKLKTSVLSKKIDRSFYQRKMKGFIQRPDEDDIPVIISYTNLDLEAFPADAKAEIIAGKKPLGRIVQEHEIEINVVCHYLLKIKSWEDLAEEISVLPTYGRRASFFLKKKLVVELVDVLL